MEFVLAALASGAAKSILESGLVKEAAAGVLTNVLSAPLGSAFERSTKQIWLRLNEAEASDGLPVNHHLERATTRAALLATSRCLATLPDEDRQMLADGPPGAPPCFLRRLAVRMRDWLPQRRKAGMPAPYPHSGFTKARSLLVWYNKLAERLSVARATDADRRQLIEQGQLAIPAASLGVAGASELARINAAGGADSKRAASPDVRAMRRAVEDAVLEQILCQGSWDASRHALVRVGLRRALFGRKGEWWQAFALFYAEEIRKDGELKPVLDLLAFERIDEKLDLVLGSLQDVIRTAHEAQTKVLQDIRSNFLLASQAVFYEPTGNTGGASEIRSFYFAEQQDKFVGRQEVIDVIEDRLLTLYEAMPKFAWASIAGSAGSGKSRLALQLRDSNCEMWPLSGFVSSSFLREFRGSDIQPGSFDRPTLFILDYAGGDPVKCEEFIARCAVVADQSAHPIRALVLVRQTNDPFFQCVDDPRDGAPAANSREGFEDLIATLESFHIDATTRALVLGPLSDDDLGEMMLRRSGARVPEDRAAIERAAQPLLNELKHYDPDRRRPLIALLLADAHREGRTATYLAEGTREARLLNLLKDHIKRQFKVSWRNVAGDFAALDAEQKRRVDRHLSFLMLSTCCRDFTDESWALLNSKLGPKNALTKLIPLDPKRLGALDDRHRHELNYGHLQALAGQKFDPRTDQRYPIMEPDLYAEALLLLMLGDEGHEVSLDPATPAVRRDLLINAAWEASPDGMAGFIALMDQDFPNALEKLDWCLPSQVNEGQSDAYLRLLEFLIRNRLDAFTSQAATREDIEETARLIACVKTEATFGPSAPLVRARCLALTARYLGGMINGQTMVAVNDRQSNISDVFQQTTDKVEDAEEALETEPPSQVETVLSPSDEQTMEAVSAMLRSILDEALDKLFEDGPVDVQDQYCEAVSNVVTSLLWTNRSDPESEGKYHLPLSEEELAKRDAIAIRAESVLRSPESPLERTAIACSLIARIVYAEWGAVTERARLPLDTLRRPGVLLTPTDPITLRNFLAALPNLHYLTAWKDPAIAESGFVKIAEAGADILDLGKTLLERAAAMRVNDAKLRGHIANAYADVFRRQAQLWQQAQWPVHPDRHFDLYLTFLDQYPTVKISQEVLILLAVLVGGKDSAGVIPGVEEHKALQLVRRSLAINPGNPKDWGDLAYIVSTLLCAPEHNYPIADAILARLISDLGQRARGAIVQVLVQERPDHSQRGVRRLDLLAMAAAGEGSSAIPGLDDAVIAACKLAISDNAPDRVWAIAEYGRFGTGEDRIIVGRNTALTLYEMFLGQVPADDPRVLDWRERAFGDVVLAALLHDMSAHDIRFITTDTAARLALRELVILFRQDQSRAPDDQWRRVLTADSAFAEMVRARLRFALAQADAPHPQWANLLKDQTEDFRSLDRDLTSIGRLCAEAPVLTAIEAFTPAGMLRTARNDDAWVPLPLDIASTLFSRINKVDARWSVDLDLASAWAGRLSFYDDVQLLRVFNPFWSSEDLVVHYLVRGDQLFRLNGVSPPIHEVNAGSLKLTPANVLDYTRFFCFFVRGEEGPFYVCETPNDPLLSPEGDGRVAGELLPHLRPAAIVETEEASYKVEANLMYSNALFSAILMVQQGGMVEMLDDQPIATDLPFRLRSKLG